VILPTGEINALCAVTPSREPFVVLGLGLPILLEVFNCLFLPGILLADSSPEAAPLERAQILVDTAVGLMASDDLTTSRDRLYKELRSIEFPRHSRGFYQEFLIEAELSWFIGHEYGHIALGHLGRIRPMKLRGATRNLDVWSRSHEEEFAADTYGLKFATSWVDQRNLPRSKSDLAETSDQAFFETIYQLAASDVCVTLIRLVEYLQQILDTHIVAILDQWFSENQAKSVAQYLKCVRASHPPARRRHERLRAVGPCHEHHSVLTIAHNAQVIIQQIMTWIHERKLSVQSILTVVPHAMETIPDRVLAGEIDGLFPTSR
jgi:hypothetical protein